MKNKETIRFLFIFFLLLLLLYFYKTTIFWTNYTVNDGEASNDIISIVSLLFVEAITILLWLMRGGYKKMTKGIHALCLFWLILMFIVLFYNGFHSSEYVKCIAWPIIFQSTYYFIRDNKKRVSDIRFFFYLLAGMGLFFFLYAMVSEGFGGQSNMIYFFVLAIPGLLVTKNKRLRNLLLIIMSFMALLSMKRSMILSVVLFWVFVAGRYLIHTGKKMIAVFLFIIVALFSFLFYGVVDKITSGYLTERLETEEGDDVTNGREAIYIVTWEMITSSSPSHLVLGHGHNAVRADSPLEISAHNEWMEILYDYGLIAIALYFCLWIYVVRRWIFHVRCNTVFYIPYTLSICIFSVMSIVSQLVLYVSYFLYFVMFWAMAEAVTEKEYCLYRQRKYRRKNTGF